MSAADAAVGGQAADGAAAGAGVIQPVGSLLQVCACLSALFASTLASSSPQCAAVRCGTWC